MKNLIRHRGVIAIICTFVISVPSIVFAQLRAEAGIWVPGGFGGLAPVGRLLDILQLIIESKGRNLIPIRSVSEGNSSNLVTRRRLRRSRERSPLA